MSDLPEGFECDAPPEGCYSSTERNWTMRLRAEYKHDAEGDWLCVGSRRGRSSYGMSDTSSAPVKVLVLEPSAHCGTKITRSSVTVTFVPVIVDVDNEYRPPTASLVEIRSAIHWVSCHWSSPLSRATSVV